MTMLGIQTVRHLGLDVGHWQYIQPEHILQNNSLINSISSICPGRHLSDNSLYSIVSCLLAVYDIKSPVDDQGNTLKLKPEFTSGFLT